MILYQVISTYQLLNSIIHKIKFHNDDKCVLFCSTWLTQKFQNFENLKTFFDDVVPFEGRITFKEEMYPLSNDEYIENLLMENKYKLEDFTEIHAMGCHYSFAMYLSKHNINFNFWEDAAGLICRPENLYNNEVNSLNILKAEFCKEFGFYDGSANAVDKIYCNLKAQKLDLNKDNVIDFNVIDEFINLDIEYQNKIKEFFTNSKMFDDDGNSILFLTQHLASLKITTFDQQALIYQLIFDYYFNEENIILKVHPDDLMYYGLLFPRMKIIREKFPAEFLPTMFTNKPKCIATVSSTAIDNLKYYFDDYFVLGNDFEKDYKFLFKYDVVVKIKSELFKNYQINMLGISEVMFNKLLRKTDIGNGKYSFNIIGYFDYLEVQNLMEQARDDDVFVFINTNRDYLYYNANKKHIWNNLIPLRIKKSKQRDNAIYADLEDEIIMIYSKNTKILNKLKNFEYEKSLKNTGLTIRVTMETMEGLQLLLLGNLLKATENQLIKLEKGEKADINCENIQTIRFSDSKKTIETLSNIQKDMRIYEARIKATEERFQFYLNN